MLSADSSVSSAAQGTMLPAKCSAGAGWAADEVVYAHPIQQLSIPLLAELLQHVSLGQRLQACAAVCTEWHTAAIMATHKISLGDDCDALSALSEPESLLLSAWLHKHACRPAVINSIKLHCCRTKLVLPVQQLPALSSLELCFTNLADSISAGPMRLPTGPGQFQGLTSLVLRGCGVQFGALAELTSLQHLGLASIFCEDEADLADRQMFNSNLPVLTDALPFLQRLTSLHLGELWARDAVVTSAQQLPCLRELLLGHSHTTAASFRYLPETLTRLQLTMRFTHEGMFRQGLPPEVREPRLGLLSTPAFLYLTALQHLSIFNTGLVHPVVLYELSALQHLDIDYCSLAATSGEPGLAVFSRFAKLQHLALPGVEEASREVLIASAADVAALTVSSHLTHLSPAPGLLHGTQYAQLFPDGRKLPHLVEVSTSMALLACCEAMQRMAGACAALESITLTNQLVEAVEQSLPGPGSPAGDAHSWQPLQRLKNLKQLDLEPRGQHVSPKAWQCLGRVTQLEHLNLGTVGLECLEGLMQLTQLSRLEDFAVDVDDGYIGYISYISMDLREPGEIAAALPGTLVELAITVHDDLQAAGDENAPVASECLARVAAAQAALSQQQEKNSQLQLQLQLEVEKLCVSVDEAADVQE